MNQVKDTARATVRLGYDGRVHKTFRGPLAEERFRNEVRVLQHLEKRGCAFVPRLLEQDPEGLRIVTTNCGSLVERMDESRMAELFAELETYGVRHDDAYLRNVTYSRQLGRFCLIDFEFATILEDKAPGAGADASAAAPDQSDPDKPEPPSPASPASIPAAPAAAEPESGSPASGGR